MRSGCRFVLPVLFSFLLWWVPSVSGDPLTSPGDPPGLAGPLRQSARLILSGKPREAVPVLQKLLRAYPDYAMVHFLLGLAYGKMDENAKAVLEEKKALILNPKSEAARVSYGIALGNTGHFRKEIQEERMALALNRNDEMAWEAIGWAYASRGNWRLARASEETAIRLKDADPSAHMVLGVALAHLGFPVEAMAQEKIAANLDPDDLGIKRAIAWVSSILHPLREDQQDKGGQFNPLLAPENGTAPPGTPTPQTPPNPNNNANGTLRAPAAGH